MRAIPILRAFLVILLSSVIFLLCTTPAGAMVRPAKAYQFTVNTTFDRHDANWGDGVCADQQGQCSLRAAIEEADAQPYGSTITIIVPAGTYQLLKGTLRLSAHRSITITGASSKTTIIEGNRTFRIMSIGSPSLFVQLSQLTIEGGNTVGGNSGGGIENFGTLTVSNSIIRGNSSALFGGGIMNNGTLTVSNSIISENLTSQAGGGIYTNFGKTSVSNSTVSKNTTTSGFGGGIFSGGTLSVSSSTFSGNWASGGGGIFSSGTLSVSSSTLRNNSAYDGGGIENSSIMYVSNSTLSNNSVTYDGGGIENLDALTVSSSTLSGNSASTGGGIDNDSFGTLSVSSSTLRNNSAYDGGGIFNNTSGTVNLSDSVFSANSATYDGGGLENYYQGGLVSVTNSTFSGNSATDNGGGLDNDTGGTLSVSSSTLSGNAAYENGGGIDDGGSLTISNSTLSGNSAPNGGGIANYYQGGPITLAGTILANSTKGGNCSGPITDKGYNLDSGTSCGFKLRSDLNNTNPLLGPLQNNGGPTQTMALLQGSPAIDWVNNSVDCPSTDQRGDVRPDNHESACDIGAYESAY